MTKKEVCKIIGFLVVLLVALYACSLICFRNLRGFNDHEDFYNCEQDTVDVIFVGGSMSYSGFSPMELYEKYGISSYNFGTSNQSMLAGYLWTMEACEKQNVKVVIVEAMEVPMSHGEVATDVRSLFSMGMNGNYRKLAGVYKRNALNVLLPVFILHDEWRIDGDTFRDEEEEDYLRGFVPIDSCAGEEYRESILQEDPEATTYLNFTYVDKLREYCEEKGIWLIFVKTLMASNEVNHWDDGCHNRLQEYTEEYGIPFIDFNTAEYRNAAGLVISEDVAADLRHMNIDGAYKATDYLGEYLLDHYGSVLRQWQDPGLDTQTLEGYHRIMEGYHRGLDEF